MKRRSPGFSISPVFALPSYLLAPNQSFAIVSLSRKLQRERFPGRKFFLQKFVLVDIFLIVAFAVSRTVCASIRVERRFRRDLWKIGPQIPACDLYHKGCELSRGGRYQHRPRRRDIDLVSSMARACAVERLSLPSYSIKHSKAFHPMRYPLVSLGNRGDILQSRRERPVKNARGGTSPRTIDKGRDASFQWHAGTARCNE